MIKLRLFNILIFLEFLVISPQSNSQQLKDYFTYYISDTSAKRQNIFNGNDIDSENDDNFLKLESDGDNLYYINNFAGNIKFTSLYIDTNLHEKPYSDIKESQILFCKYNINSHSLNVKKFGSNYFNKVWLTKIDEKKRNICTIISTCDDTVRLDPSNQNDFISFIDRKERLWMLVINTEGKLISKLLIAEYNLPSNIRTYDHHKIAVLSKFENNDNIIFPFKSQNALRILPDYEAYSFNLKNGVRYILCFNIKTNKLKWVKKLIATNQIFVSNNINNIKMTVCVQLSKKDSLLIYSDFNNKNTISYNFNYENLFDDEMITYIFKFDTFGNITPLFNVTSKKIYEPEDRTIIENIIENNSKLLVLLSSNNDSIKIFNKYIIGKPDPLFPYTKSKKKIFFFEIDINNQKTNNLLNNINDSIIPLNLIKTINGFYTLFRYSNTAVNFNLNKTDTIINFKDDDYFKYPENLTFHTICKYDTNYEIKWLNKGFVKNIFDINNKNIIINYFLKYPRSFDIDFRPEQIGQIKPVPIMMMEAIYNCKPISYYKSEDIGKNTVKFTNLGEYNCSYKWDFGDGTSTTQKSPYHKFASKTQSYKVSLITTNSCGSDTFYRYYSFSAGLTSFKYNSQIKIYPNPIRGNTIKIEMLENTEIKSVKIYSPTGQQLDECSFDKTEKTNYTATIGSKLSKGIYYVKIILDDNTGYVTKVIIGE